VGNVLELRTETQKKLSDCLSNKNWGASSTLKKEIARLTFDFAEYPVVMDSIWSALGAPPGEAATARETEVLLEEWGVALLGQAREMVFWVAGERERRRRLALARAKEKAGTKAKADKATAAAEAKRAATLGAAEKKAAATVKAAAAKASAQEARASKLEK
jgi:hypothetical protein